MTSRPLFRLIAATVAVASFLGCEAVLKSPTGSTGGTASEDIVLSSTTINLMTAAGGTNPVTQTVTVSAAGSGSLLGLQVGSTVYSGGASGWATVSLSGSSAPAMLSIDTDISGLSPGTYTATIPVTAPSGANSPQNVLVILTVNGNPVILLSPDTVTVSATAGGGDPPLQPVDVDNAGVGTLSGLMVDSVVYGAGASGWLTAGLTGGTAPATLNLQAATGGLAAGVYTATVYVGSSLPLVGEDSVLVEFDVSGAATPAKIAASPTSASFTGSSGGTDPAPKAITVTNSGGGTLTNLSVGTIAYSGGGSGWLGATFAGTTAPTTLTLQPSIGTLSPGVYQANVPIQSPVASNSGRSLLVTLTISGLPTISLSPTSLTFTAASGGGNPAVQSVQVTNGGGGTLDQLQLGAVSYGSGQPGGWLSASLSGTTAPASVVLSATTGSLPAGTYTAQVPVNSSLSGVASKLIDVTFSVTGGTGSLAKISGDGQLGYPDSILGQPVVARVYNASGGFAQGVQVTWTASQGGQVLNATSVSNSVGQVQANWKLGPNFGQQTLQVSAAGLQSVSFSANALQAPGTNPGEPPGFTIISDRPFNAKVEDGWLDRGDIRFSIQPDNTAPKSAPNVGQASFPTGYHGGTGPINTYRVIGQLNNTQLYFSFWMKISANFVGGPTNGVNKVFHIWINGGSVVVFSAQGQNMNPIIPQMRLQNVEDDPRGVAFNLNPNIVPGTRLNRDQWYRIDLLLKANTPGVQNGEVSWWVDGTQVGHYTNVGFVSSTNTTPGAVNWQQVSWNPTWGGPADVVPATQYIWMDHFYLSGHR